jgi:L-threonylcarbamoyladenylate synthase
MKFKRDIFEICLGELKKPGAVLLLPTETVYGLMCNWDDLEARDKIRAMKEREAKKPFQMLAPSLDSLIEYGLEISDDIAKMVDKHCPGALTIIANSAKHRVDDIDTVGFRIPNYPFLLDLMNESGMLLAATSANIAKAPPAVTIAEALDALNGEPNVAVNAGEIVGLASTVVDMTGSEIKVLREGAICLQD